MPVDRSEDLDLDCEEKKDFDQVVLPNYANWHLYQWVDAQDPNDSNWYEAQIILLDPENQRVKVHFKGYYQRFDIWIGVGSNRIHDLHSHTVRFTKYGSCEMPNLGIWMDVLDANNKWFPGQIVQVDLVHRLVKVHYYNWPSDHDEWINGDSYRLAPLHRFTETHSLNGLFKKSEEFKDAASLERQKCVAAPRATLNFKASVQNELKFRELLKKKLGAVIVDMENDGNCLFRSISHQVYGDPSFHHIVRAKCVDYLESESLFFSKFVVGDQSAFENYVAKMRTDGEWGDHVEIQAMSEIYNRPIEIYAYNDVPLNIYHKKEDDGENGRACIRLSYHFQSHYNSIIIPHLHSQFLLRTNPGEIESQAIQRSISLREQQPLNSLHHEQGEDFSKALNASRVEFEKRDADEYEKAVKISLEDFEKSITEKEENDVQNAVAESLNDNELKTALQASVNDIVHVEKSVIDSVIQQSQNDYLQNLAYPVQMMLNAGYPLDRVNEAHAMVISIMGNHLDDDSMIRMMTNYLLDGDIFSS